MGKVQLVKQGKKFLHRTEQEEKVSRKAFL